MFIRRFSPLRATGCHLARAVKLRVYVIYFLAHCAGVTTVSPHNNLSRAVKTYRLHRRMRLAVPAKKTNDFFIL